MSFLHPFDTKEKEFIRIWNKAKNPQEVADELGYTYSTVVTAASRLRRHVYLKKFNHSYHFYQDVGRKGGSRGAKDGAVKGFAANPELARIAGARGGRNSRRGKAHA